jgi:hypothetical protein
MIKYCFVPTDQESSVGNRDFLKKVCELLMEKSITSEQFFKKETGLPPIFLPKETSICLTKNGNQALFKIKQYHVFDKEILIELILESPDDFTEEDFADFLLSWEHD